MVERIANSRPWRILAIVSVLGVASQVLPVTRLVIAPEDVEIRGYHVTAYRSFPMDAFGLPRPRLSYIETVTPLSPDHNGGARCERTGGPFQYTKVDPVGRWQIPWAVPCLSDPQGFTWCAVWTWHVGNLTFGPTSKCKRIIKG